MELPNPQHELFAKFAAQGLSLTEAAKRSGYTESGANNSGSRISRIPAVARRIEELRQLEPNGVVCAGARSGPSRVTAIESRWVGMRQIIAERAQDPEMQNVPGGKTGLLAVDYKLLGSGPTATIKTIYKVDAALLYELRQHEELIAEELGQRVKLSESRTSKLNLNLNATPKELNVAFKTHFSGLTDTERAELLKIKPELADIAEDPTIIDAVPSAEPEG